MTSAPTAPGVRVDLRGVACVVTFDAPERGNRLTIAAMRAFIDALRAAHDAGCLLLNITGEGPDFCLGRLQGEMADGLTRLDSLTLILEANTLLRTFPGVSIAQVQGRAYGFGAGVALQCDLTLASEDARFAFDEIQHGLAPLVVAEYLPRFVGGKRAQSLLLTGRELDARTAEAWGMVTDLVPTGEVRAAGDRIVAQLEGYEAGALRLMKRYAFALRRGELDQPEHDAVAQLDAWLEAGRPANPPP